MPDRRETLSIAGSETDENLKPDFTYEQMQHDLWADIDAVFPQLPERQPGDIDASQIAERYDLSESGARDRMKHLVRTGKWQLLEVADSMSANGKRKVIRKVK